MTTKQILLTGSAAGIDLPSSVHVGQSDIPFSSATHNLGIMFLQWPRTEGTGEQLCQLVYVEIRHISSIRQHPSGEANRTLVSSLALSKLDYCNAVLAGCSQVLLNKVQSDQLLGLPHLQSSKLIPHHSFNLQSLLAANQQLDSIQSSSRLHSHCLWYSFSIPFWFTSSLFHLSFSSFSIGYSGFPWSKGVQEDSWGEVLSAHWTCHLKLSFFLCQTCHVTLLFQVKTENPPLLFCLLIPAVGSCGRRN